MSQTADNKQSVPYIFFGTPEFACMVLDELVAATLPPSLIVTAPDRPQGRKLVITPPPVSMWAAEHGIPVLQPEKLDDAFIKELEDRAPEQEGKKRWPFFALAAYGKIIPSVLLNIPEHGMFNVHPSLLPRFRGASPIQSAILADERTTGATIMQMDSELDHGPILAQKEIIPEPWPPRAKELETTLAHEGGKLLAETMSKALEGKLAPTEQNHAKATFTKKIRKTDALIDLAGDPYQNFLKIRAFDEWPRAYFFREIAGKQKRIVIADAAWNKETGLTITRVIPEGRGEMSFEEMTQLRS